MFSARWALNREAPSPVPGPLFMRAVSIGGIVFCRYQAAYRVPKKPQASNLCRALTLQSIREF